MKTNEKMKLICALGVLLCLFSGLLFLENSNLAATRQEYSSDTLETFDRPASANSPNLIYNWSDLNAVRTNLSRIYILMNELNSSTDGYDVLASPTANGGLGWEPIGTDTSRFTGSFDGQGYEIKDLCIDRYVNYVGLFGAVGSGGKIENLGVVDVNVSGNNNVGGLVGRNHFGTVSYSYSTGSVSGNQQVGGLVGINGGTVNNSYSTGNVSGTHIDSYVGGLIGTNSEIGTVSYSYATGNVSGNADVGGLVGSNSGTVSHSYATGNVSGSDFVGGLVGFNQEGTVSNTYSAGSVSGSWGVGGLVGNIYGGTVSHSYSTGNVSGNSRVGGLVGFHQEGTVSSSYSTGSVTRSSGTNTNFGGFVGYNWQGKILNCYSTGSVHYEGGTDPTDKGFAGSVVTDGGYEMTGNFWDTETSGQTSTAGGATGKTTAQMMNISTFTGAGWSIIAVASDMVNTAYIWNIVDGETYPFLSWEKSAYELTMIASPDIGGTAIDLTGGSHYAEGTQVSIRAEAAPGYRFVNWSAPAGEFANPNGAETTYTMPDQNVTVAANFELIPEGPSEKDPDDAAIPGYNLLIFLGAVGILSTIVVRKKRNFTL